MHDVVKFARSQNILCQGRGSAANSAVCYALGITEVDPARMSCCSSASFRAERNEPPDIDVDFEHQRREEVIQYIYRKYGRDRAALAATVISYRPKSALRDVGKALGFDLGQVDRLAKSLAWWDNRQALPERLARSRLRPRESANRAPDYRSSIRCSAFPRHLSQHVGGFVIARGPLSRLVPIENAAMPERTVIQWDKDDLEALGLLKVDVLALGMLSAIRRALDMIGAWRGKSLAMADIPPEDPVVYAMIQRADTVGVFQIESRAQMSMLPRLKPDNFYDLVIEVAIVRPGPIQGGMVHPYLRRKQGLEQVSYPSEAVKRVLERTLGVPIFQEQVMQLAVVAAGFTPGEADLLRRSMAAWKRKGGLEHLQQRLISGMLAQGYKREFADADLPADTRVSANMVSPNRTRRVLRCSFMSRRGSNATSRRHFSPRCSTASRWVFMRPSQLVQDARRHGVEVRPVDVAASAWECTLEPDAHGNPAVRLGFSRIIGLAEKSAERLIAARSERKFESVDDLARRARLDARDLKLLASANALAALAGHRRMARWQVAGVEPTTRLLEPAPVLDTVPALAPPDEGENLVIDYASTGLTLGRHPLALLRSRLSVCGCRPRRS